MKSFIKKRSFKKASNIFLSFVLLFNIVGVSADAIKSNLQLKNPSRIMVDREGDELKLITTVKNTYFSTHVKRADNGEWALCMQPAKPAPIKTMYTKGDKIDDLGMKHIALSEPNMGTFEEDFYVKQVALNYYQGKVNYLKGEIKEGQQYRDKAFEIAEKAKKVRDGLETSEYFTTKSVNLTQDGSTFTFDGEYYTTDWFNFSHEGNLSHYTVNVSNAPEGVQILNKNEEVVNTLTAEDDKFKVRIHRNNVKGSYPQITVSVDAVFNELEPTEYHPDDTQYQIVLMMDEYPLPMNTNPLNVSLNPVGGIDMTKTSEDGTLLEGAEFDLVKDGRVVDTKTTNKDGKILFEGLTLGQYSLVEKKAPNGHVLNSTPVDVNVNAGINTVIKIKNEVIKGKIAIQKTDKDIEGLNLEGAVFEVYDNSNTVVDKLVTNKDGYTESKLLNNGTYTVKEISAPEGYKFDKDKTYTVNIEENNKIYLLNIKNEPIKANLHIVKVNSKNEEVPVPGAGFDIITKDVKGLNPDDVVASVVTDKDGFAYANDLRYGDYAIREVKTPDGFWKPNKDYSLEVREDGKTYVKYIKNEPIQAKIRVIKTDGIDKVLLDGVKFKIVDKKTNKEVVFKEYVGGKTENKTIFTTDSNGEFITPQELNKGEYQLVEVESKEGYVLGGPIDFVIDENTAMEDIESVGRVVSLEVENNRIVGDLNIDKVDTYTKEPLVNVEFEIECLEGFAKGKKYEVVTNEEGKINVTGLEYGKYRVIETKTVEGYVLNSDYVDFEIKENGEVVNLVIENKPIEGVIDITKTDAETKRMLPDAEFTVYDLEGNEIQKVTTNKDGKALTDKIKVGTYKVVETKAPYGYVDNKGEFIVEIKEDGEVVNLDVENDLIKGELDFSKTDFTTGEVIEGAKIEIVGLDETNKHIKIEFVSSKEGNRFTLPVGNYEIRETIPPAGYELTTEVGKFEIKDDGKVVKAELKNKKMKPVASQNPDKPVTGDTNVSVVVAIVALVLLVVVNKNSIFKKN